MTSRELLEHIRNAPSFMGGDTRYEATTNSPDLYLEDIAQIEKDLEVLELLKRKRVDIGHIIDLDNCCGDESALESYNACLCNYAITQGELDLIKEWLENEN